MIHSCTKLAFSELAAKVLKEGRKPARKALSAAEQALARRERLLAAKGPKGRPKYMEVPRSAYGSAPIKGETAGKGFAEKAERARKARESEELLTLGKQLSRGKTIGGFTPGMLGAVPASKAVKTLEKEPFLGGGTVFQGMPAKVSGFRFGFLEERERIRRCP